VGFRCFSLTPVLLLGGLVATWNEGPCDASQVNFSPCALTEFALIPFLPRAGWFSDIFPGSPRKRITLPRPLKEGIATTTCLLTCGRTSLLYIRHPLTCRRPLSKEEEL
jgi:hypothetical protein